MPVDALVSSPLETAPLLVLSAADADESPTGRSTVDASPSVVAASVVVPSPVDAGGSPAAWSNPRQPTSNAAIAAHCRSLRIAHHPIRLPWSRAPRSQSRRRAQRDAVDRNRLRE